MQPHTIRSFFTFKRTRWLVSAMAIVALMVGGAASVSAASTSTPVTVTGSPSNFESGDGNMVLDTSGNTDWNCFVGGGGFQSGTAPSGCKVTSGATDVTADSTTAGELELKPGTKFDIACPIIEMGSNPPKDEFTNVASFSDQNSTTGDVYFYGAEIRTTNNGNASGNIELNQNTSGCRTAGDRLLAFDFLNGGAVLNLHLLTWVTSGSCNLSHDSAPCWGANVETLDPSLFTGLSNQSTIGAADNGISGVALAINQFGEFGTNLSQALFAAGLPSGSCFAFPQEEWESRSSGSSFGSNPEDIEIEKSQISNCGSLGISKVSTKGGALAGATFEVDKSSTKVGGGTTDSTGKLCITDIPTGTYTVKETVAPSGYDINTKSQTANVGLGSTCDNNTVIFQDTPLTDISVTATSEVAKNGGTPGATKSTITCVITGSSTNIGNSPQGPTDPATVTANGLKPGSYTCTVVVIDP